MGFMIYCNNKGCRKEQEPFLDISDNEVYCSECGGQIKEVTIFAKTQMKAMGQIKRERKVQQAFSVSCGPCKLAATPTLVGKVLCCPKCKVEHVNLSKPMASAIKEYLRTIPKS